MEQLILIHGALGNGSEFDALLPLLKEDFKLITYELPGHGKRANELENFSMEKIIIDFESFLNNTGPSYIFGFSLGGYLALSLALQNETNIKGIITLGTKLNWSPEIALKETQSLSVDFLKEKAPPFYDYLVNIHNEHLPQLLEATAQFMLALGNNPLLSTETVKTINIPVHLLRGGKDRMVTREETETISTALSTGVYYEIPSFPHPLGFIQPKLLANVLRVQHKSFSYSYLKTENFGTIAYHTITIQESKEAPTLLFLHEALGSIAQWKDFPEQLCNRLQLNGIVIELNGYGFSDKNPNPRNEHYLHDMAWKQLPEIIAKLPIPGKLLLVGHSDGGTNALLYAQKFPEKIAGIVTMAAHVINEEETKAGIQPAIEAYEAGKLKALETYHFEKTEKLFYDWAHTWRSSGFENWDIQKDIDTVTTPVLALQGDLDQYGTVKQLELIKQQCKGKVTTQLIIDCGHAPHIEQQAAVINHITAWKNNSL